MFFVMEGLGNMRRIIIDNPKEYIRKKKTIEQAKSEIRRQELLRGADTSRSWPGVKSVRVSIGELVGLKFRT